MRSSFFVLIMVSHVCKSVKKHYICHRVCNCFFAVIKKLFLYINLLVEIILFLPTAISAERSFVVVVDAGHGGKDPGARGSNVKEKDINLAVALKLGRLLENKTDDVRVIYTRKTDRFVELDERANIANRSKADLFISIHTNAVKRGSSVRGTETYTLGLARSEENLEVAMSENSAILLEDDYKQRYEGFDPNSSESYIIFEFMQNKHMEQSIGFASEIQKSFQSCNRVDRGVRQAGFLVLRKTSMPSVLVELGYISNRQEEQFMSSEAGQDQLAKAMFDAFLRYKNNYDRRKGSYIKSSNVAPSVNSATNVVDGKEPNKAPAGSEAYILAKHKASKATSQAKTSAPVRNNSRGMVVYKVQILTSDKRLPANSRLFKGLKNVDNYVERGIYKYTYGETTDFQQAKRTRREVSKKFKDAFIVAFKDGKKVKY